MLWFSVLPLIQRAVEERCIVPVSVPVHSANGCEIEIRLGELWVFLRGDSSPEALKAVIEVSLMLTELTLTTTVYLVTGYSNLRKDIEGLAAVVQENLSLDPFNKSLYLFCGRRRDRIKGLLW